MNSQKFVMILMLAALGACSHTQVTALRGDPPPKGDQVELTASGVSKDGIPALSNPDFVSGRELGVSGILLEDNLVMYDRSMDESLWAQMLGGAICGTATGKALARAPLLVTSYDGWQSPHPDTTVLSAETALPRNYGVDPYEDHARLDAPPLYRTATNQDSRRLPRERGLRGRPTHLWRPDVRHPRRGIHRC